MTAASAAPPLCPVPSFLKHPWQPSFKWPDVYMTKNRPSTAWLVPDDPDHPVIKLDFNCVAVFGVYDPVTAAIKPKFNLAMQSPIVTLMVYAHLMKSTN